MAVRRRPCRSEGIYSLTHPRRIWFLHRSCPTRPPLPAHPTAPIPTRIGRPPARTHPPAPGASSPCPHADRLRWATGRHFGIIYRGNLATLVGDIADRFGLLLIRPPAAMHPAGPAPAWCPAPARPEPTSDHRGMTLIRLKPADGRCQTSARPLVRYRPNTMNPFAGSVIAAEAGSPSQPEPSATTRPPLPTAFEFGNRSYASLLNSSRHSPPDGKPVR